MGRSRPNSISVDSNSQQTFDVDELVKAVESFATEDSPDKTLCEKHDNFFHHVAKTGDILTSWKNVKEVFIQKLTKVIGNFHDESEYTEGKINNNCENLKFDDMKKILIEKAMSFENVPFTFQRLCELLSNPSKNYTRCDKYMRALDKNMKVVSSWNTNNKVSNDAPTTNGTSSELNTPVKNEGSSAMYPFNPPMRRQNLPISPMLTSSGDSGVKLRYPPNTNTPIKLSLPADEETEKEISDEKMEVDDEVSSTSAEENTDNSDKDVVKNNTEEKTTKQNDDTIDNSVETKQPDLSKAKIPVPEVSDQSAKDVGEPSTVPSKRKLEPESDAESQEASDEVPEKKVKVTKEEESQVKGEESSCEEKSSKAESSDVLVSEMAAPETPAEVVPAVVETENSTSEVSALKLPESKVSDDEKSSCVTTNLSETNMETSSSSEILVCKTESPEVPVSETVNSQTTDSEIATDEKAVSEKLDEEKA